MISKIKYNSKCLSPVVATSLLLVVAVSSVVFFQGWFNDFSSSVLVDVESDSSSSISSVRVDGIINDNLYLNSKSDSEIDLLVVKDELGNEVCSFENSNVDVSDNGLVGYWKFDDFNSSIKDYSGQGNDGKLYGNSKLLLSFDDGTTNDLTNYNNSLTIDGATYNSSCGLNGGCYEFDGIDDKLIKTNFVKNFSNGATFSIWFKLNGLTDEPTFFHQRLMNMAPTGADCSSNYGFTLNLNDKDNNDSILKVSQISFSIWDDDSADSTYFDNFIPNKNQWYHIGAVASKEDESLSLYLDGNLISKHYINDTLGFFSGESNCPLKIGEGVSGGASPKYVLNGSVDEIGIYSMSLTNSEIKRLYNLKKVEFMEFENDGLRFDGIDDFVGVDSNINLDNNFTFIAFVSQKINQSGIAKNQRYITYGYPNEEAVLRWDRAIGLHYYQKQSSSLNHLKSFDFLELDKKYMAASVFNSSGAYLFKNDELLVFNNTYSGNIDDTSQKIVFGSYNNLESESLKGKIYEIRIYDRGLSSLELNSIYYDSLLNFEKGANKLDLSSCNLDKNKKYDVLIGSQSGLSEVSVIVK